MDFTQSEVSTIQSQLHFILFLQSDTSERISRSILKILFSIVLEVLL